MRGAGSNVICTTALNSIWSPWGWNCAQPKRLCPPKCIR
jgi:hypothetical protein